MEELPYPHGRSGTVTPISKCLHWPVHHKCWESKDGVITPVYVMRDSHLLNCISWIEMHPERYSKGRIQELVMDLDYFDRNYNYVPFILGYTLDVLRRVCCVCPKPAPDFVLPTIYWDMRRELFQRGLLDAVERGVLCPDLLDYLKNMG